jgi:hypothetical protein
MALIIIFLFILISIVLIAFSVFAMSLSILSVPFVPIRDEAIEPIIKALKLNSQSLLYDLGSGDGKVIFAAYKAQPQAQYVGIEYHFFPHWLAKRKLSKIISQTKINTVIDNLENSTNIELIHNSFFNEDISQATHVFVYLFSSMLDKLLPKLENDLRKGTRLVSCDFTFSKKEPIEVIDIPGGENRKRCKKLYIYEF